MEGEKKKSHKKPITTKIKEMKKSLLFIPIIFCLNLFAQQDCENFKTFSPSYILPKTIAAGIDYFTEIGFTGGIGAAYTVPKKYKKEQQLQDSIGNYLDIFALVGWRVVRIDYVVSVFANVGYTMGNEYKAQPFTSVKILFPLNKKAFSIEPLYIFGRGLTGKLSLHFKF